MHFSAIANLFSINKTKTKENCPGIWDLFFLFVCSGALIRSLELLNSRLCALIRIYKVFVVLNWLVISYHTLLYLKYT